MKIAINAILMRKLNTGVENYIHCLLHEFDHLKFSEKNNITVYLKKSLASQVDYRWQNLRMIPVYSTSRLRGSRIFWEHLIFPLIIKSERFDLVHAPGYIIPI